jgi:transcriptional regulator with XRE-family HTH domain
MNRVAVRFGQNLKRCRSQAGISQETLGERTTLHRTEIGLLERGARMPRIDTLLKLSHGLEIPVERLIEGIAWTPGTATRGEFSIGEAE